jgi:segregation and condensation protein B
MVAHYTPARSLGKRGPRRARHTYNHPMANGTELDTLEAAAPPDERDDIKEMASAAETILFALGEAIEMSDLRRVLAIRQPTLERVLEHLSRGLADSKRGIRLQRHGEHVRLVTAPENALYVSKLRGQPPAQRLSDAALEVLALLAYYQPATRPQLEAIRGVDCSGVLTTLMSRGLVEEVGRLDTVGHPVLYSTTLLFLQHFGLEGTHQLPPVGDILGRKEATQDSDTKKEEP